MNTLPVDAIVTDDWRDAWYEVQAPVLDVREREGDSYRALDVERVVMREWMCWRWVGEGLREYVSWLVGQATSGRVYVTSFRSQVVPDPFGPRLCRWPLKGSDWWPGRCTSLQWDDHDVCEHHHAMRSAHERDTISA